MQTRAEDTPAPTGLAKNKSTSAAYYAAHPEKRREHRATYYAKHPEKRSDVYYAAHPEKRREHNATYRAKHPDIVRACRAAWWTRHGSEPEVREKMLVREATNNAIQRGILIRLPCEKCGQPAEAHHDDYSRPMDVRWLCRTHHAELHREKQN
jgi:hypothetical protein